MQRKRAGEAGKRGRPLMGDPNMQFGNPPQFIGFVYMKKLLCLMSLLLCTSSFAIADDSERTCASNAYLVEDRFYVKGLDYKNRTKLSELPEWVPTLTKKIYQNTQALPINATHDEILEIFKAKPKIQNMGKVFQKFTWDWKDEWYQCQLSISRPLGCISRISMLMQENKKEDRTTHAFVQNFKEPSGVTAFQLSKDKDACKKRRVKRQKYQYLKDGKVPPNNSRDIPEYASMVFQLIDAYYNHKRVKVTNKIGLPTIEHGSKMQSWSLKDTDGSTFLVTLRTVENCDEVLKIEWVSEDGVVCSLIKENFY